MKLNKILLFGWTMIFVGFLIASIPQVFGEIKEKSQQNKKTMIQDSSLVSSEKNIDVKIKSSFDSIVVIHFHPTVQCSCCINVGNFAQKGLEKYYPKPYKDKRIIFKEYNIDEDSLTAKKYKIFWSALGFKKLLKEKEEFKEIESVWEFCEDEEKFLPTFKKELDAFISGSEKNKLQDKKTK